MLRVKFEPFQTFVCQTLTSRARRRAKLNVLPIFRVDGIVPTSHPSDGLVVSHFLPSVTSGSFWHFRVFADVDDDIFPAECAF